MTRKGTSECVKVNQIVKNNKSYVVIFIGHGTEQEPFLVCVKMEEPSMKQTMQISSLEQQIDKLMVRLPLCDIQVIEELSEERILQLQPIIEAMLMQDVAQQITSKPDFIELNRLIYLEDCNGRTCASATIFKLPDHGITIHGTQYASDICSVSIVDVIIDCPLEISGNFGSTLGEARNTFIPWKVSSISEKAKDIEKIAEAESNALISFEQSQVPVPHRYVESKVDAKENKKIVVKKPASRAKPTPTRRVTRSQTKAQKQEDSESEKDEPVGVAKRKRGTKSLTSKKTKSNESNVADNLVDELYPRSIVAPSVESEREVIMKELMVKIDRQQQFIDELQQQQKLQQQSQQNSHQSQSYLPSPQQLQTSQSIIPQHSILVPFAPQYVVPQISQQYQQPMQQSIVYHPMNAPQPFYSIGNPPYTILPHVQAHHIPQTMTLCPSQLHVMPQSTVVQSQYCPQALMHNVLCLPR